MINLACPNCGGSLVCDPLNFVEYNGIFIYTNQHTYACQYCKSKFERNQSFLPAIPANINTDGGAYIAGNINVAGTFVGRDLITTIVKNK